MYRENALRWSRNKYMQYVLLLNEFSKSATKWKTAKVPSKSKLCFRDNIIIRMKFWQSQINKFFGYIIENRSWNNDVWMFRYFDYGYNIHCHIFLSQQPAIYNVFLSPYQIKTKMLMQNLVRLVTDVHQICLQR